MSFRTFASASAFAALAFSLASAACGGCPWTHVIAPSVRGDGASCVKVDVANANGSSSAGGCVDPDLVVTNTCDAPMVVHEVVEVDAQDTYPDGGVGDVTIPAHETRKVETRAGGPSYDVQGEAGDKSFTISFSTSR